jgi:hypothetical protein
MPKKDLEMISQSIVVATENQVSTNLEDEAVILHLKDGVYFGLNQVGARIWNLLQVPRRVSEIRDVILEKYDVEPQQCEQDLLKLLKELHSKGLINIRDGKAA